MADVTELKKLSREKLNEFAKAHGIDDADNLDKFPTKDPLAVELSPRVTPEQLEAFKDGGEKATDTPTNDQAVAPQTPPTDDAQIVDNSAPADDNIESVQTDGKSDGVDRSDPNVADRQPGDPSVRQTREDGTVVERDATEDEIDNAEPADNEDQGNDEPANGDESGQSDDEDQSTKSVKLKNPTGKVVDVLEGDVVKRRLFEHGFTTVKGESYPDEVTEAEKAFADRSDAQRAYSDHDQSDALQSDYEADVKRRGESNRSDDEKATQPVRRKVDNQKPSENTVDTGENGQLLNRKGNPKSDTRLAAALSKK